jgi:hypothetical protein
LCTTCQVNGDDADAISCLLGCTCFSNAFSCIPVRGYSTIACWEEAMWHFQLLSITCHFSIIKSNGSFPKIYTQNISFSKSCAGRWRWLSARWLCGFAVVLACLHQSARQLLVTHNIVRMNGWGDDDERERHELDRPQPTHYER